jgi:hypothetical protein
VLTVQGAGAAPLHSDNNMKLGVFALTMKGGAAITTAEGTLGGTWEEQPLLVQAADRAGYEFLLTVPRWRGLGGPSDFAGVGRRRRRDHRADHRACHGARTHLSPHVGG